MLNGVRRVSVFEDISMGITIGTAPDAWGVWFPEDSRQTPWSRFLDEVVEAGYEWIELGPYGYLPTSLDSLREELDKRALKLCACMVEANLEDPEHWPQVEEQLIGGGELTAALGGQYLVLIDDGYCDLATGQPNAPVRLGDKDWARLIETVGRVAKIAVERFGLSTVFHPNAETHVEHEDQIERLLDETDPERVSLCLDIGHHAYRRGDAIEFIRKHHARMPHIHFKNVDEKVLERVESDQVPMVKAVEMDVFCELPDGIVDYAQVRDVLQEVGYEGFAIVEQDMFPAPFDAPLPIATRARSYLRNLGIG